jgi:methylated-DNA-[protein]-cysteine S-methyltransferase
MTTGLALFATAIGSCGIAWTTTAAGEIAICGVQLPEASNAATTSRLARQHPDAELTTPPPAVATVIERVVGLLDGAPDDLRDIAVDLDGVPQFSRQVLDLTREVGPGQTTTYGEIATKLGAPGAAQQVGQALGHNPVPLIVPCHRVLGAGNKLVGFSAAGGVITKLRLLDIEGAEPDGQPALF